jgi:hypothetical protein
VYDFEDIAGVQAAFGVRRPRDDLAIALDGDWSLGKTQVLDEAAHGQAVWHLVRRAVYGELHAAKLANRAA